MASAVPLFSGLKHLPCPKEAGGVQCTTSGCLFGHRADEQAANTQRPQSPDDIANEGSDANSEAESPPKKRQKTTVTGGQGEEGEGEGGPDGGGASDGEGDGRHSTDTGSLAKPDKRLEPYGVYDPLSLPSVSNSLAAEPLKAVTPSSFQMSTPTPPGRHGQSQPLDKPATPLKSSASAMFTPASTGSTSSSTPSNTTSARKAPTEPGLQKPAPSGSSASPLIKSSPIKPIASPLATGQSASQKGTTSPLSNRKLIRAAETLNPRHLKSAPAAHGVRHKLLTLLHAELVRLNNEVSSRSTKEPKLKALVLSNQELVWMALDREHEVATQKAPIYPNIMKQDVMRYRKTQWEAWVAERTQALEKKPVQKTPDIGPSVVINTGLTPEQEVEILGRLATPITNLHQYGYVPTAPTDEQIAQAKDAADMSKGWEQCDRCTARFQVFPGRNINTGELASGGQCTHHPGKQYYPDRPRGDTAITPKKYRCCNENVGDSLGCAVAQTHVWKVKDPKRLASLWNFAETPVNDSPLVKNAVAFDCEMGYTVHGMELVRVTATSWPEGTEIVDVLVQPFGEILDLNSKYSGVFPEDLARAVPWTKNWEAPTQRPDERKILQKVSSPEAARDLLFSFISPDTMLIGHGLENDLNAMRIIHPKIVDTILLYPHRRGLPIRTSLKALMETHLNRRIQVDTGEGHDSAEDARAAGDLVRLRVQKEWLSMQVKGWKVLDGVPRAPGWQPPAPERSSEESVDREEGGVLLTEEFLEAGS